MKCLTISNALIFSVITLFGLSVSSSYAQAELTYRKTFTKTPKVLPKPGKLPFKPGFVPPPHQGPKLTPPQKFTRTTPTGGLNNYPTKSRCPNPMSPMCKDRHGTTNTHIGNMK